MSEEKTEAIVRGDAKKVSLVETVLASLFSLRMYKETGTPDGAIKIRRYRDKKGQPMRVWQDNREGRNSTIKIGNLDWEEAGKTLQASQEDKPKRLPESQEPRISS